MHLEASDSHERRSEGGNLTNRWSLPAKTVYISLSFIRASGTQQAIRLVQAHSLVPDTNAVTECLHALPVNKGLADQVRFKQL